MIHGSLPNTGAALRLGFSAVAQPKTCRATFVRARDREVRGTADVYWQPLPLAARIQPARVAEARHLTTVDLDQLAFGPAGLDRVARLHARLHPGARGCDLPADTSCRP